MSELEESRLEVAAPGVEVLDGRPLGEDEPAPDPEPVGVLREELYRRQVEGAPQYALLGEGYWLGWADAIVYLRQEMVPGGLEVAVVYEGGSVGSAEGSSTDV